MYVCKIKVGAKKIDVVRSSMKLESFYKMLDCELVESVALAPYGEGSPVMLVDESGKIKGKPMNRLATEILWQSRGLGDFIVGDVAVVMFDGIDDWTGWDTEEDVMGYMMRWFG